MCIDCAIEDVKLASSIGCLSMLVFPALKMHRVIMNFQEGSHFVNMDPFRYLHCFLPSRLFFHFTAKGSACDWDKVKATERLQGFAIRGTRL